LPEECVDRPCWPEKELRPASEFDWPSICSGISALQLREGRLERQ
jgi:hypothetical protein